MGNQPNLASRSEVVSIYKCHPSPKKNKFGAQKHRILDHFFAIFALDTAYLRNETPHERKNAIVNVQCVPKKLTYFPWPLTQKQPRSVGALWPTLSAAITLQPS